MPRRPLLAGGTLYSRRAIMRQTDYGGVRMNMTPILVSSRQIVWHVLAGVTSLDEDENRGNAGCGLNLEASAGL